MKQTAGTIGRSLHSWCNDDGMMSLRALPPARLAPVGREASSGWSAGCALPGAARSGTDL
jgi:hypothetical protein